MTLLEQLRALIVAEAAIPPIGSIDPMGMMTGIPLADMSGVPEYEAQAAALLAGASSQELHAALAEEGDPADPVAEMLRRELGRRREDAEPVD